jgi:hypothetical protein
MFASKTIRKHSIEYTKARPLLDPRSLYDLEDFSATIKNFINRNMKEITQLEDVYDLLSPLFKGNTHISSSPKPKHGYL